MPQENKKMPYFDALKIYSVENIVGKGEIACYEQFLLFLQCFQKQVCC